MSRVRKIGGRAIQGAVSCFGIIQLVEYIMTKHIWLPVPAGSTGLFAVSALVATAIGLGLAIGRDSDRLGRMSACRIMGILGVSFFTGLAYSILFVQLKLTSDSIVLDVLQFALWCVSVFTASLGLTHIGNNLIGRIPDQSKGSK